MVEQTDKIIKGFMDSFSIFILSAVLIYATLDVSRALYPAFPLSSKSNIIIATIIGIFITFLKRVKKQQSSPI